MKTYKCTYGTGDIIVTGMNATPEEARDYFVGQAFDFGDSEEHPKSLMIKCVSVSEVEGSVI